jgi:hypothetical protein
VEKTVQELINSAKKVIAEAENRHYEDSEGKDFENIDGFDDFRNKVYDFEKNSTPSENTVIREEIYKAITKYTDALYYLDNFIEINRLNYNKIYDLANNHYDSIKKNNSKVGE